jgi:hypothetical protein
VNDGLDKEGMKLFEAAGIEADCKRRDAKALVTQVRDFDALVVRSATAVTREVIESASFLSPLSFKYFKKSCSSGLRILSTSECHSHKSLLGFVYILVKELNASGQ